ncbi:MAG: hypothetical protein KDK97_15675, partial [Verrucomicrobiales bacterium]|nr:hypothetical protein [Verrucomicrobiales bacterium]
MPRRTSRLLALIAVLTSLGSAVQAVDIAVTPGTFTANTTLVDGDIWAAGNVGINSAAIVNIPDLATVTFQSTLDRNLTSNTTGTFQIDLGGRFVHATTASGDNLILAGAVNFVNNGTYEFASGGDLRLQNDSSSFINSGLILKTAGSVSGSNDPSYIFPNSPTTGGSFSNSGDITVNAGHLNIAGGSSTAGTFTTTTGGNLSFSGKWTELTGVSDTSGGGSITISNENPATTTGGFFTAAAATTTLNVTGNGLTLGPIANIALNGNTLRNDGILLLASGTTTVSGTGSFENGATGDFRLNGGAMNLNGGNLTNKGLMALTTGTVTLGGTASLINDATGTFNFTAGTLAANTAVTNEGLMNFAGAVTISGSTPITNAAIGTMSLISGTITLTGNNIINNGTAEFAAVDGNVTVTGTGRFINNADFNHIYGGSNDNFILNGSATFENNGTFDFQERGDIQSLGSSVIENNGLIIKSVAGIDPSYIFRDATGTAASLIAATGSELRSNAGVLHVAVGGTSDPGALWTADGGHLGIAGQWTGTVAGSSANSGRVRISSSGNPGVASNLLVGAAGLTLAITGDGLFWDQSTIGTQGNTVTNEGIFAVVNGGTKTLSGGGELINAPGGSLNFSSGEIVFEDSSIIRNQGTMNLTSAGGSTFSGTGTLINDTDGTTDWSGSSFIVNAPAEFHNLGSFDISGTTTHTLSGTGVISNDAAGTMDWTSTGALTIDATANLVNDGTFNIINSGNRTITGAGTITNNGTFNQSITDDAGDNAGWNGTGQFVNNGLFAFTDNGDYNMEGGTIFTNSSTGTVRINSPSADQAQFFSFTSGTNAGTFDNQGTVEVLAGNFRITTSASGATFDDTTLTQNDGFGTLTGGTWIANSATTGSATIDLDAFGNSSGIITIGQNAVVDLTGSGSDLLQLSSLETIDGQLYVNGSKSLAGSGSINLSSTGVLGGDGTLAANLLVTGGEVTPGATMGTDIGILTINSTATFDTGSVITLDLAAPLGFVARMLAPTDMALAIVALGNLNPTSGQHDALAVTGALAFTPGMTINVFNAGVTLSPGQFFDLFDFAGLGIDGVTPAEAEAL